jgi:hypothetical protein
MIMTTYFLQIHVLLEMKVRIKEQLDVTRSFWSGKRAHNSICYMRNAILARIEEQYKEGKRTHPASVNE